MKVRFRGSIGYGSPILKDISVEITSGEITCILGPNGSGKTTLLKTLANILPPIEGKVEVDGGGEAIYTPPDPPYIENTFVGDVVLNYVSGKESIYLYKLDERAKKRANLALQLMRKLGLNKDFFDRYDLLSTGEKAKVILASALASRNNFLYFDEPNNHLDLASRLSLYGILKEEAKKRVIAVALHDLNEASQNCGTVILLGKNIIIGPKPAEEVLTVDYLEKIYSVKFLKVNVLSKNFFVPLELLHKDG